MKIKVCGMTNKQNLKQVAALQPDYVGFIFYDKSPRHINSLKPLDMQNISARKTGVFVNSSYEEVSNAIALYGLDAVQLHGEEGSDFCSFFKDKGIEVIKAFGIDTDFDFTQLAGYYNSCDHFLFDTKGPGHGGNGFSFNWSVLKRYDQEKSFFLSGGIGLDNIEKIHELEDMNLYGVDINSRVEDRPGIKNINMVRDIISFLKNNKQPQ